jgi:hypothetical protein
MPQIDDPGFNFFEVGSNRPDYRFRAHDVLVLTFDADLYSSAMVGFEILSNACSAHVLFQHIA